MEFYDPLYGRIDVPEPYIRIVNSRAFRRLQHLRQLGLCHLSFPGGNHTRFEHSLGAFYLARRIGASFLRSTIGSRSDREYLCNLICAAALCHDIGHGPLSHISENTFLSLGGKVTHEELGAAIISFGLGDEFSPLEELGISRQVIGSMLRKEPTRNPVAECATELVSSDLDVDRLDYLHRDSHYSGVAESSTGFLAELDQVWGLSELGGHYYLWLTEAGVNFAERILFLRRNNYQRIVFESRHMAATSMFEKSIYAHWRSDSNFAADLKEAVETRIDWGTDSAEGSFRAIWRVLGQVDYEFLKSIERGNRVSQYLVQRLRRGQLYESVRRYQLGALHVAAKRWVLSLVSDREAFKARRLLEDYLSQVAGIDRRHVAVNIPKYKPPKALLLGVEHGKSFTDESELGGFFAEDYERQYAIEVFVDSQVVATAWSHIESELDRVFCQGFIYRVVGFMADREEV